MTVYAFIADVHVANHKRFGGVVKAGINRRCYLVLEAMRTACKLALAEGADVLVIAGDLFHSMRPEPQIVAAVQEILYEFASAAQSVVVLPGNHDSAHAPSGDHAVGPLAVQGTIVPREPMVHISSGSSGLALVPYLPGQAAEWLDAAMHAFHQVPQGAALVAHVGVADATTPPYLRAAHDAVHVSELMAMMSTHGFNAAFCGNWHEHRSWQDLAGTRHVVQVGALAPTGFNNPAPLDAHAPDLYGSVVLYNDRASTWWRRVVPGPRFVVHDGWTPLVESALELIVARHPVGAVHFQWSVEPDELVAAIDLMSRVELSLGLGGVTVQPRKATVSGQRIMAAASAAFAASSPEAALRAYLVDAPLPAGCDRDDVAARCAAILSAST